MIPQASIIVKNLTKYYPINAGVLFSKVVGQVKAVDNISFSIPKGGTFGLVGESGSGKSTTANMILGLETPTSGEIRFDGEDVHQLKGKDLYKFRRNVQAVFQDPFRSLNPRKKVSQIISEPMIVQKIGTRAERMKRVTELMNLVGLSPERADQYPHEFSGGQRQRIAIARALSLNPQTIVLDEPVSALDVSIQAQILNLLIEIQNQLNLTYLIISHDLAVVEHVSSHVGVMYLGKLVEFAPQEQLYGHPSHPYTQALIASVPVADPEILRDPVLEGEIPSPLNPPPGCTFNPRCPKCEAVCTKLAPESREISPGHWVSCHLIDT